MTATVSKKIRKTKTKVLVTNQRLWLIANVLSSLIDSMNTDPKETSASVSLSATALTS